MKARNYSGETTVFVATLWSEPENVCVWNTCWKSGATCLCASTSTANFISEHRPSVPNENLVTK